MSGLTRKNAYFPIVTDGEQGIINAIVKYLPNATRLQCWNHIFRNARFWCHSHNVQNDVIQGFIKDLRELSHQQSFEAYEAVY